MKVTSVMKGAGIVVFILVTMAMQHHRTAKVSQWPQILGEVEQIGRDEGTVSVSVPLFGNGSHSSRHSRRYPVAVAYRYEVNGVTYHGSYQHGFFTSSEADQAIAAHPIGSQIALRYDPVDPDDSELNSLVMNNQKTQ